MSMPDLYLRSASDLARMLRRREVSAVEVVEAHLAQIDRVNGATNAIVTLTPETAVAEARRLDRALVSGDDIGPLHGVPVVHKDLHDTAGVRTTYGSTIYSSHVPDRDAVIVSRMRAAGAISVGKSNTPEFGTGSQTYNAVFGATRNPYDLAMTPGGSSGGSAAALGARMVPFASGTDMGGSLRNPASFCNVVGFRPSAGVVPQGPSESAWASLAVDGPMARSVDDVALMLSVVAGFDPWSPIAWPGDGSCFRPPLRAEVRGLRVAWGSALGGLPIAPEVRSVLDESGLAALETLGCVVDEAEPDFTGAEESFRTLRAWHYASWFADEYANHRAELNSDTAWNVECGLGLSGADLARAERLRSRLHQELVRFFERYDVLALPVSPVTPFPVEQPWVREIAGEEQHTYLDWMRAAYYVSATGLPAVSVPCGFTDSGLPIGVQFVGRPAGDLDLLRFAHAFESVDEVGRILPGEQPGAPAGALAVRDIPNGKSL